MEGGEERGSDKNTSDSCHLSRLFYPILVLTILSSRYIHPSLFPPSFLLSLKTRHSQRRGAESPGEVDPPADHQVLLLHGNHLSHHPPFHDHRRLGRLHLSRRQYALREALPDGRRDGAGPVRAQGMTLSPSFSLLPPLSPWRTLVHSPKHS